MNNIYKKIENFYKQKKSLLIALLTTFIILGVIIQFIIFYSEKMTSKDISFESVAWSEYCDGDIYNSSDKDLFCNKCFQGKGKCEWPLDINISIKKVERTLNTLGEIHCFFKIDGINYYTEKGSFYGITQNSLFTWHLLDSTKSHSIDFCCGIERESIISTIFGLKKPIQQACISKSISPRCAT